MSINQPIGTVRKIRAGDTVLIRVPTGDLRSYRTEKDSVISLGRFGSFFANGIIDQIYGLTYEIVQKSLKVIPPRALDEVEDTDATNELINDGESVQPLTLEEIEAFKKSGVHATDIIKKQIEQHANYSLKTEYSKEKYKKRKEQKYLKSFTTVEPTIFNVSEYWFNKDKNRIRDLRADTLSQMLSLGNVRPGGRYIAVDEASGLLTAAILDRMGGDGRLFTICDVDSPPAYPVLPNMNFEERTLSVLVTLNWATSDADYTPPLQEEASAEIKSDKQKGRVLKRKAVAESLRNARDELFAGEFDGVLIASQYEPFSLVERLFPYLAGSAPIVVQSPHVQILSDLQGKMRPFPKYLAPSLTEAWLRKYQVLPGRTHPMMSMSGSGGYILHAIKVYDDPSASSVMAHRRKKPAIQKNPTGQPDSDTDIIQDEEGPPHP